MSGRIDYRLDGDVAVVGLDDPASLNALSAQMGHDLKAAVERAGAEARAILLCGSARGFCSGANLSDASGPPGAFDAGERLATSFNPMMIALRDSRVPIVSAVRGAAAGIGASLALACDIVVAGRSAYFLQAFCRIGLVPDGGSPFLLTKSVGRIRALELMLLGDKLPAPTALEWGLITRVVDDEAVEAEALALARRLAQGPTRALGLIRRIAWAAETAAWEEQLTLEAETQREAGATQDFAEGVAAFLQKRPAQFTGR